MAEKFMAEKQAALERFEKLLTEQLERAERIKSVKEFTDYGKLDKIIIGVCGGDGIGPYISAVSRDVLEYMLKEEIESGKVELRNNASLVKLKQYLHNLYIDY